MEAAAQSTQTWKPFSLTHVTYPVHESSSSSYSSISSIVLPPLLALLSLAPPFGTCGLFVSSFVHRDVVSAYLLTGALMAVSLTSMLKSIIRHPRPPRYDDYDGDDDNDDIGGGRREYGMPSNHSCFVWFVAAFAILYVMPRVDGGGVAWSTKNLQSRSMRPITTTTCDESSSSSSSSSPSHSSSSARPPRRDVVDASSSPHMALTIKVYRHLQTTFVVSSSLVIAIGCSYSRIYLGYHTTNQVLAGSALGTILGIGWHGLFGNHVVRDLLIRADAYLDDLELHRRNEILVGMAGGGEYGTSTGGPSSGVKRE